MSEDARDPMEAARSGRALPKRFYKAAAALPVDGRFAVALDGRIARTPAGKRLAVERLELATALAAEWEAQGETIDPASMPLTRILNAALDRVVGEMAAVRADIVAYAGSDLICYRADEPEGLIDAQNAAWEPMIRWAQEALGVRLNLAEGVMPVAQSPDALAAIASAVEGYDAVALAALHIATTLTGSAILALALARGRLSLAETWDAAHVDEDWQMSLWGVDEIAMARRGERFRDLEAAAFILGR
jgi:chaperone required for assembly of F1-ATPase